MRHISGLPPAIGLVALAFSVAGSAPAADPVAPPPKPDWAGLESRMVAGDYAAAVTAADAIVELVRPKPRAPDFLPRSIELTRALMRRGLANLRLGDLDAAEESFTEAYRIFKDKDFQRLVSLQARQATPAIAAKLLQLELDWLELLEIRTAMLAERLRHATLARSAGEGDISPEAREAVVGWLDELPKRRKAAAEARESLAGSFAKAGTEVLASPYYRALVGEFRPEMTAGVVALERARLAATGSASGGDATTGPPTADRRELLLDAERHFAAAAKALEEAVTAAKPAGTGALKPERRLEAALMEAELLANRAELSLQAGAPAATLASCEQVLELLKEVAVLRKRPDPASHPDRFWPLLMAAEAAIQQSHRCLADGDADGARAASKKATNMLGQAVALPFPEGHPLRRRLAGLEGQLGRGVADLGTTIPRKDAAEAAARRVIRALDATAPEGIAF